MIKGLTILLGSAVLMVSPALASGVIVYPAKGQSADQQKKDEGECVEWASQQTGFNPTDPLQAWANQQAAEYAQKQSDFNRAYAACLTSRGDTVD